MMYLALLRSYLSSALDAALRFATPLWNNPATRYAISAALAVMAAWLYGMHRERRGRELQKVEEKRKDAETLERIEHASIDAVVAADRIRERMRAERVRNVPGYTYRDDAPSSEE